MSFYEELDGLAEVAVQANVEDVHRPYVCGEEDMKVWMAVVENTLRFEAGSGNREYRIIFINPSSWYTVGIGQCVFNDDEDESCKKIGGKWIRELNICPRGFYYWYLQYLEGISRTIEPAQLILKEKLKATAGSFIQELVDYWNKSNPSVKAELDNWDRTTSILFSWHKKRQALE